MAFQTSRLSWARGCGGAGLFWVSRPANRNRILVALGLVVCLFAGAGKGDAATFLGKGVACKLGYEVRTDETTISDHTSLDNVPVGDIRLRKACSGPVVGTFTASLTGNLHLHELWAYCISNGGFGDGCVTGQNIYAQPPHTLLQSTGTAEVSWPIETVRWIWPLVPPGEWRFRLLPAAFVPVTIKNSTFTVEAFTR